MLMLPITLLRGSTGRPHIYWVISNKWNILRIPPRNNGSSFPLKNIQRVVLATDAHLYLKEYVFIRCASREVCSVWDNVLKL
jgi:hypothetical protein